MVKFSSLAFLVLAASSTTGVSKIVQIKDRSLRQTNNLLKKARPYRRGKATRSLQEENEFAIDGSYNVKFSQCVDIKTYDEDLFNEEIVDYVKTDTIVSSKSYVLFHLCQEDDCYYDGEDDLYIVDLNTFLASVVSYHGEERKNYCQACEQFEEQCAQNANAVVGDDAVAADDAVAGGERKLSAQRRAKAIDCAQCQAYECFVNQENADVEAGEDLNERVAEWIKQLSECQQFEGQEDDKEFYYGPICSAEGEGIEFALFLDRDCTMFTRQESFENVYNATDNEYGIDIVSYAEDLAKTALSNSMSCLEAEYSADDAVQGDDYVDADNVNKYCEDLLKESFDFNECNAGNAEQEYGDRDDEFNWYIYDLTMEDTDDIELVCSKVKEMDGEYYHAYYQSRSGTWHSAEKSYQVNEWSELSDFASSTTELCVVLAAVIICVLTWWGCSIRQRWQILQQHKAKKYYPRGQEI